MINVVTHLPVDTAVLIRGNHGIGKSQLARLIAKIRADKEHDGIEREVVDIRLSQMTEGDMLGLPSTDGKVTRWNPMEWFQKVCDRPCVLLLDELNRATGEVMQGTFQIILDRELAGKKVHPDTLIISTINIDQKYSVNEMDPALLDRFWVCDLDPDVDDWLEWAGETNEKKPFCNNKNIHSLVVSFIRQNNNWLDTPKDLESANNVSTSRRSWEKTNDALCKMNIVEEPDDDKFFNTVKGFLGQECAIAFRDFAKTQDRQVSAEDVLERYTTKKIQKKMKDDEGNVPHEKLNDLIKKISTHCIDKGFTCFTEKQGKNVQAFVTDLSSELRIVFWTEMVKQGASNISFVKDMHKWCGKLMLDIFGVLPGAAGVGMTPKIPDILNKNK